MKHWTRRRWASLGIHVAFVSVPFTLSTASALLFWRDMFQSWTLSIPMVAVIEVLSLVGLVLFLTRIESPFVALRHLLPFISIVPLGRELYLLLAHNPPAVAWGLTALATGILVVIAWQCFRTIERLFIDPMDAAREQAHAQVAAFRLELAQHEEMSMIVDGFVRERMDYHRAIKVGVAVPQGQPAMLHSEPQAPAMLALAEIVEMQGEPQSATLDQRRATAARMRADGKSWRQIADAVGRSPSAVREWLAAPATQTIEEEQP